MLRVVILVVACPGRKASPTCFKLLTQLMRTAFALALASAGNNRPAKIAMMAMTTKSSIRVKAPSLILIGLSVTLFHFSSLSCSAFDCSNGKGRFGRLRVIYHCDNGTFASGCQARQSVFGCLAGGLSGHFNAPVKTLRVLLPVLACGDGGNCETCSHPREDTSSVVSIAAMLVPSLLLHPVFPLNSFASPLSIE